MNLVYWKFFFINALNTDLKFEVVTSCLFSSLQGRGARAVFQFYPEDPRQVEIVTAQAIKAGFSGGVVVDYPNSTKAKKFFLVLMTAGGQQMPAALGTEGADNQIANEQRRYVISSRFCFCWNAARINQL